MKHRESSKCDFLGRPFRVPVRKSAALRRSGGTSRPARKPLLMLSFLAFLLVSILAAPAISPDQASHACLLQEPGEIPHADAGPNMTVVQGTNVHFDGTNSTDDVGIVNYTWTFTYGDLFRTFVGPTFDFKFVIADTYVVTLNVTDADGHYDTDTVTIEVTPKPVDYLATYWWVIPVVIVLISIVLFIYLAIKGKIAFISEPRREKMRLEFIKLLKIAKQLVSNFMGLLGLVILVFFITLAIFGPMIAPYSVDLSDESGKFEKRELPSAFAIDAPSYVVPLKAALPLTIGLLISGTMLALMILGKPFIERYKIDRRAVVYAFLMCSFSCAIVLVYALSLYELENPECLVSLSAVGLSSTLLIIALRGQEGFKRAKAALILPVLATMPVLIALTMDLGSYDTLSAIAVAQVCVGIILATCGLVVRSADLKMLAKNPEIIATKEGEHLRKGARLSGAVGVVAGSVMIVAGFISVMQGNWTTHWMGTDLFGFDIYSELLYGARTSMIVGVISAIIASVVGAGVGLYSGYAGGWKDEVLMRANDVVLSIPWLVLMIIIAGLLRTIDLTGIILIIGLTGWSPTARLVRSQVLSLKERQYVERARAIGASDMSIIRRHILPNAFPLVFANTILIVAVSILSESTLSFLGLRPVGTVTWGTMLSYASDIGAFRIGLHWWILAPGICIVLVVLGFTLVGYALDDILNPKLRKR